MCIAVQYVLPRKPDGAVHLMRDRGAGHGCFANPDLGARHFQEYPGIEFRCRSDGVRRRARRRECCSGFAGELREAVLYCLKLGDGLLESNALVCIGDGDDRESPAALRPFAWRALQRRSGAAHRRRSPPAP